MPIQTASIATLGCKLNQAESYRIQVELARAGVDLLPFGEPVDLSIVNTCTVTHVADQQGRQLLRRAARISPGGYVVAMGCYAQVAPEEVASVEGVDLVVTSGKEALVGQLVAAGQLVGNLGEDDLAGVGGPDDRKPLPETRVRQFVKVQDGCDDYCTYCIVPFARGHSTSRSPDAVVAEVQELVARGCREVVLTGVQIGAYGRDRWAARAADPAAAASPTSSDRLALDGIGVRPPPGAPLAALVRRLLAETAVARIRISSIQPQDWPSAFLELFADPRLCRHLHLPLQAGSDTTLRRMGRRYTTAEFAALVNRIRRTMPEAAITADMIVGFPGETERHHQESLRFAREMEFAATHVFRYSPRSRTAASRMADQVPPETKRRRSEELRALADDLGDRFRQRFVGRSARVLWEEELADRGIRRWSGLTDNYLRATLASPDELLGVESDVILETIAGESFLSVPSQRLR